MGTLKKIISITVWCLAALYLTVGLALRMPFVQRKVGTVVASVVENKIGAKTSVGRVDWGFFNRIVIDDICINDQRGETMLKAKRAALKIGITELIAGRIRISSAQLFGPSFNVYQTDSLSPLNIQFALDSLSSTDNKEKTPLDMQVHSFIIRRGEARFRQLYKKRKDQFNTADISISKLSGHFVVNKLTDTEADIKVKRLSLQEQSGLYIKDISFSLSRNNKKLALSELVIELPASKITSDKMECSFLTPDSIDQAQYHYKGIIRSDGCQLKDFAFLHPAISDNNINNLALNFLINIEGSNKWLALDNSLIKISELLSLSISHLKLDAHDTNAVFYADLNLSQLRELLPKLPAQLPGNLQCKSQINAKWLQESPYPTIGSANLDIKSDIGNLMLLARKNNNEVEVKMNATDIDLCHITGMEQLGNTSADLLMQGQINGEANATIVVKNLTMNDYPMQNIEAKLTTNRLTTNPTNIEWLLTTNDPALALVNSGSFSHDTISTQLHVKHLSPSALRLTNKWGNAVFAADTELSTKLFNLNDDWKLAIRNLKKNSNTILHNVEVEKSGTTLAMNSSFGTANINGQINFTTLKNSIMAIVAKRLPFINQQMTDSSPTTPVATPPSKGNAFSFSLNITHTDWVEELLGVPFSIEAPISAAGEMSEHTGRIYADLSLPAFTYNETPYRNADLKVSSPGASLVLRTQIDKMSDNGLPFHWEIDTRAANNRINTTVKFDNHNKEKVIRGTLKADAFPSFSTNANAGTTQQGVEVRVHRSTINFGDSVWTVEPSEIDYRKNNLTVKNFRAHHNNQHITLNGRGNDSHNDSLTIDLKDVDVPYILDFVNFHSVEFNGLASGHACLSGLFTDSISAATDLTVRQFLFETGRLGTLFAHGVYNMEKKQIDINAHCDDDDATIRRLYINGFVSPANKNLDLRFKAENTRLEFMQSFCSSFLQDIEVIGSGNVRLAGGFKSLELTGKIVTNGTVGVSSLNTWYTLENDTIHLQNGEIQFVNDRFYDRDGHEAVLSGSLHHHHLSHFSYDVNVKADNFLAYDTHHFGDNTFYGTAFATGTCHITGRSGELRINVAAMTEPGSILVYNAASPDALTGRDFVAWNQNTNPSNTENSNSSSNENSDSPSTQPYNLQTTNMHFSFDVDVSPKATLRVLMDPVSGDYIDLWGNGALRCEYYNKGAFDIFGNYVIDHGTYKLTIQNVLRRDFRFLPGGTIAFGGDAYNAALDMQAQYTLNGVSLSDLNIGSSFSSNNVRVDCLMNITGTPAAPRVDFSLDMPTVNSEAKQMVYSLMNSEEDVNNQVLYLLAVGRFYQQPGNNATGQQSQTSLAMQSILSGTISQQINTLLAGVVNNSNWTFGANISTGDEGFNNAEYEGLLSGQLLNNRLLFDGQFGYRDKANATSSFIGDFDLKYLLVPNGDIALRMYNQANDRYFTKSSLNTQGLGLILKHDFNRLWPKKKTNSASPSPAESTNSKP